MAEDDSIEEEPEPLWWAIGMRDVEVLADLVYERCAVEAPRLFGAKTNKLHELAVAGAWAREMNVVLDGLANSAWEEGATWAQIGDALGISRQAAAKRFEHRFRPPDDLTSLRKPRRTGAKKD